MNNLIFEIFCLDFDTNHIQVKLNIPSVPTTGDNITVSCSITVPTYAANPSSVRWTYTLGAGNTIDQLNSNATVGSVMKMGNTYYSNLTLNNVETSDAREYYCIAVYSKFREQNHDNRNMSVNSKVIKIHSLYNIL